MVIHTLNSIWIMFTFELCIMCRVRKHFTPKNVHMELIHITFAAFLRHLLSQLWWTKCLMHNDIQKTNDEKKSQCWPPFSSIILPKIEIALMRFKDVDVIHSTQSHMRMSVAFMKLARDWTWYVIFGRYKYALPARNRVHTHNTPYWALSINRANTLQQCDTLVSQNFVQTSILCNIM